MSITLNTVQISSKGLSNTDAILCVTVPTGSSVTAAKSGTTLTPTIWTRNADNTLDIAVFVIPSSTFDANSWTVTATLNGSTATDTITINAAQEYEMSLSYILYLYNSGDECTDVTGGWSARAWLGSSANGYTARAPTITRGDSDIRVVLGSSKYSGVLQTANNIDLTDYSTLHITTGAVVSTNMTIGWRLGVGSRSATYWYTNGTALVGLASNSEYTIDVSSLSGSYDVYVGGTTNGSTASIYITSIWLTP